MTEVNKDAFFMKSKEASKGGFDPLVEEDYIVLVAKVDLKKFDKWNSTTNRFDGSLGQDLQYELFMLPYKLKADDGLFNTEGKAVAPLSSVLFKKINPFAS